MPGPLPKDPSRRQNRVTKSAGVVALDGERPKAPAPVKAWDKSTVASWKVFWASPAAELVAPHQLDVLVRLFDYRDRIRKEWAASDRAREIANAEPFIEGSQGQPRPNPMFKMSDEAASRALALEGKLQTLEAQFPLSPASTLKLGVTFQQKQNLELLNAKAAGSVREIADPRR